MLALLKWPKLCLGKVFVNQRELMQAHAKLGLTVLFCALGLVACQPQAENKQAAATQAEPAAKTAAKAQSNLPFADYSNDELQTRWNEVAVGLDMEQFVLRNCKQQPAVGNKTLFMCRSTGRGSVYFERIGGKVTRVQFVAFLGMFSERLSESSKVMVRFLHHNTAGDDITLYNSFNKKASHYKKFCVPSPAIKSQLCHLVSDKSYAIEARGFE